MKQSRRESKPLPLKIGAGELRCRRHFFMKILENNNKTNNLEENLIVVETIPIKEYTYNRLVVSFRGKLWII